MFDCPHCWWWSGVSNTRSSSAVRSTNIYISAHQLLQDHKYDLLKLCMHIFLMSYWEIIVSQHNGSFTMFLRRHKSTTNSHINAAVQHWLYLCNCVDKNRLQLFRVSFYEMDRLTYQLTYQLFAGSNSGFFLTLVSTDLWFIRIAESFKYNYSKKIKSLWTLYFAKR